MERCSFKKLSLPWWLIPSQNCSTYKVTDQFATKKPCKHYTTVSSLLGIIGSTYSIVPELGRELESNECDPSALTIRLSKVILSGPWNIDIKWYLAYISVMDFESCRPLYTPDQRLLIEDGFLCKEWWLPRSLRELHYLVVHSSRRFNVNRHTIRHVVSRIWEPYHVVVTFE